MLRPRGGGAAGYFYEAFGLVFQFPFACPEMGPARTAKARADVVLYAAQLPDELSDVRYVESFAGFSCQVGRDQFLLKIDGVGHYLVDKGTRILLDIPSTADRNDFLAYLFGSCFGVLLHQRGIFPLHASAIQTENGAIAFAGHSGAGKSTLLTAFQQRGFLPLADDVTGVLQDARREFLVAPASPRIKLAADSAAKLSVDTRILTQVQDGPQKFSIASAENWCRETVPLFRIYILTPHENTNIRCERLIRSGRLAPIVAHTFRREWAFGMGKVDAIFRFAVRIASRVSITRVYRPRKVFRLDDLVARIVADAGLKTA
jgi:hypothetical protein